MWDIISSEDPRGAVGTVLRGQATPDAEESDLVFEEYYRNLNTQLYFVALPTDDIDYDNTLIHIIYLSYPIKKNIHYFEYLFIPKLL